MSQALQRVEERVGVRLVQRTTRRVSLTEPGRRLYERCGPPMMGDIDTALRDFDGDRDAVVSQIDVDAAALRTQLGKWAPYAAMAQVIYRFGKGIVGERTGGPFGQPMR